MNSPTALRELGRAQFPTLVGPEDALWQLVFDLGRRLDPAQWELVGGLMVVLHGIAAGRVPPRPTADVDVLAHVVSSAGALEACVTVVEQLGFKATSDSAGHVYRFVHGDDRAALKVDVLAPDHLPPGRSLRTRLNRDTISIGGGRQALERIGVINASSPDHGVAPIPVPDLLGALVLKAVAWTVDSRDVERHAEDAAFLTSLIADPLAEVARFKGSDRKRLRMLDKELGRNDSAAWQQLGSFAVDAQMGWRLLIGA